MKKVLVILQIFVFSAAEWIEIPQQVPKLSSPVQLVTNASVVNAFDDSSPSAAWLEYQRERFANQERLQGAQKLIVSSGSNLKNSAKVVAAPVSAVSIANLPRHQIIHTKLGINVVDLKLDAPYTENAHVEITSRKYTPPQSEEIAQETVVVEEEAEAAEEEEEEDSGENSTEVFPTFQGFMDFLKILKKDWTQKAALTINQKIKMLEVLRDNLMAAIEGRFMAIWQPKPNSRKRRGILDQSNFQFPPEAALMTINFLTFAVFLIKLVLNVVHIIKSKHYNFAGFTTSDVVRNRL